MTGDDPRERDDRCCGDHPGAWDTPALPGSGFCAECLLNRVFPLHGDDEVSDEDLLAITAINTGGPIDMQFPVDHRSEP